MCERARVSSALFLLFYQTLHPLLILRFTLSSMIPMILFGTSILTLTGDK